MSKQMSLSLVGLQLSWSQRIRGLFALILAYIVLHSLRLSMIGRILRLAKHYCSREISIEEADVAWEAVRQSSFFFLGRAACLELSLAFVIFALTKGLSVTWSVGVRNRPFEAHAWVEICGRPFHEPDYVEQEFKRQFVA